MLLVRPLLNGVSATKYRVSPIAPPTPLSSYSSRPVVLNAPASNFCAGDLVLFNRYASTNYPYRQTAL
jgi:hypothetical protein